MLPFILEENSDAWEPPWMYSAHGRKTHQTEKEPEQFAVEFVFSMGDTAKLKTMIKNKVKSGERVLVTVAANVKM